MVTVLVLTSASVNQVGQERNVSWQTVHKYRTAHSKASASSPMSVTVLMGTKVKPVVNWQN